MNVIDLFEKLYGVKCDVVENPITDTVTTAVTQLLKNDPGRCNWTLVNLGATPLYFCFTPDPSANKGIYVAINGGYVTLDWKDDGILVTRPIYAVSTGTIKVYLVGIRIIGAGE